MAAGDEQSEGTRLRIFDVGARNGLDERWKPYHDLVDVTGFEPNADECARLNAEAAAARYPARFLPYALARETRDDTPFHVARWPVASSLYPPNPERLRDFPYARALLEIVEERRIRTMSLDEACSREGRWPDYLKLDVEGAELDILVGGEEAVREALVLDVEVEFEPIRLGQPLFADIDSHLRTRGWRMIGLSRVHWDARGGERLVQGDALYYNAAARAAGLTPEREQKLALILAAYEKPALRRVTQPVSAPPSR